MQALDGSVVLVAGASGGLGSRIAALLEAEGALVVRAGRTITGPGAYLADLRTPDGPASLVAAALAAHGRLDGVVVAAGVVGFGLSADIDDDTLDELFETNAIGPIRLLRAALPALRSAAERGTSPFAVTMSGIVAEVPTSGMAAYSASKAALHAFVQASSREFRRSGVRLVDARPGHTETELSKHPIAGTAPALAAGMSPDEVASRIVEGIVDGEKDLPSSAF